MVMGASYNYLLNPCLCYNNAISAPDKWSGPLGKDLTTSVWLLPVGTFVSIDCPDFPILSQIDLRKQSNDMRYGFRMCIAIIAGLSTREKAYLLPNRPGIVLQCLNMAMELEIITIIFQVVFLKTSRH